MSVGGDISMDIDKMSKISTVLMFVIALIKLLKSILWG
jgi:hypothetical protein